MSADRGEHQVAPGGTAVLAGREVARIGFGVMQLEHRALDRDAAIAILRTAISAGINHFDTAHFYGSCNALIRSALAPYRDDLVLVSKVGATRDPDGNLIPAQQPGQLRAQVETDLASLGADRVGVVNLRRLDTRPGLIADGDQQVDLDDQLAELAALRDEGKIGGIPGTADPVHLAQNTAAGALELAPSAMAALDQLAAPAAD
jgi:pyridoxine 4-dehydrogenase